MIRIKDSMNNSDIDDLLRENSALKDEVFRLTSIIENLPGSIYWKDINGTYLGRNQTALEKMYSTQLEQGQFQNDFVSKTDYDFFPKDIADDYRNHDLEVMQSQQESTMEEPVRLPNGKTIIQLSTKRPLYDAQGKVTGIVGNTIDITHLKTIEAELREAKELAEQANLAKTEFIRNMEHDIRTPFIGVWSLAKHIFELEEDPSKKELLNEITQCAKELLDYCNSVIDISKIESGSLAILEKKFHPASIIKGVIKIEKPAITFKGLTFENQYDPKIPSVLLGDPRRLQRILINLVSNAIKFTHNGLIRLTSKLVSTHQSVVLVRFTIEDTGIGIANHEKDFIFEKFTRLSLSNQGHYKGAGLGLRIVKQFMHEMGGEIDLISAPDQGTQFICTVPFRRPLTEDYAEQDKGM